MKFLNQEEAKNIDIELFNEYRFSVDQLMELAGHACATAVSTAYPPSTHPRVLVAVGPGNNGGDGLVAARHLWHFGHRPVLCMPRDAGKELYTRLLHQCTALGIEVRREWPAELGAVADVVVDAVFGFSFHGAPRAPYDAVVRGMAAARVPVCSVDVPSGWHVEEGDVGGLGLAPALLVSLTAPKQCARQHTGQHWLGGRFVPPALAAKYGLDMAGVYPGTACAVRID